MVIWITGAILIFAFFFNAGGGIVRDSGNATSIDSLYFSILLWQEGPHQIICTQKVCGGM